MEQRSFIICLAICLAPIKRNLLTSYVFSKNQETSGCRRFFFSLRSFFITFKVFDLQHMLQLGQRVLSAFLSFFKISVYLKSK